MPIVVKDLSHIYMPGTPMEVAALRDISLRVEDGQFVGLIGHTGSGKSTFVQHLNALLAPTSGTVIVDGIDLTAKNIDKRAVRRRVGLVFQYPEHQLFEETVYKDIAFGPTNLGLAPDEIDLLVRDSMTKLGLNPDDFAERSPFDLSGGQRRRVAIAGVLAMNPDILVLDEPTSGLDPQGKKELLELIATLHRERGIIVLMVTHGMDDINRYAQYVFVMDQGRLVMEGPPEEVFENAAQLRAMGLGIPESAQLVQGLRDRGFDIPRGLLRLEPLAEYLAARIGGVGA